ncbi:hypothetical protein AB1Y20_023595 [Prymnesium parvum]|uniref:C2 NT-type domain-containing protein n=1 Tax=Prymnesium parvum TaxID=97485 RepID=A0AB34JGP9_PRYPA
MRRHMRHLFEKRHKWSFHVLVDRISVAGREPPSESVSVELHRGSHTASTAAVAIPRSGASAGSVEFEEMLSLTCTMFSTSDDCTFRPKAATFKLRAGRRAMGACRVDLAHFAALAKPKPLALTLRHAGRSVAMLSVRVSAERAGEAAEDGSSGDSDASTAMSDASAMSDISEVAADLSCGGQEAAGADLLSELYATRPAGRAADKKPSYAEAGDLKAQLHAANAARARAEEKVDSLQRELRAEQTARQLADAQVALTRKQYETDMAGFVEVKLELAEAKERIRELEDHFIRSPKRPNATVAK